MGMFDSVLLQTSPTDPRMQQWLKDALTPVLVELLTDPRVVETLAFRLSVHLKNQEG